MRHQCLITFAASALVIGSMASPGAMAGREPARSEAIARQARTIAYGGDPLQQLDFHPARAAQGPAPLIAFVHGGGWQTGDKASGAGRFKAPHFNGQGYHFASINYRLVPDATVEEQAQDVAKAVAELVSRADVLGIDRSRVVLIGHSAGAHLVALVGTDPRYLRGAGLSPRDLAGVIPIDGAAYDVPTQMTNIGRFMMRTYRAAFGTDLERQNALSPIAHAARPNAASFLILHVERKDGVAQAIALEKALVAAGTATERRAFPSEGREGHAEINRRLGDPNYAATPVVDRWLAGLFR